MMGAPVTRDLTARGEPHLAAPPRVLEEARQAARPRRTAGDATVQAHRHHARARAAFLPELVEGVAEVRGEVLRHLQGAAPEADVVGIQGVGNDEPGAGRARHVVRQVVRVGVAVVEKRALSHYELPRVHRRAITAIPPERRLTGCLRYGGDGPRNGRPLRLAVQEPVLLPAMAVGADVPAARHGRLRRLRIALEGDGAREDGALDLMLVEHAQQAPEPGPAAVFEERLVGEIALAGGHRRGRLTHALATLLTVLDAVLGSFLVVDDHVHGHASVPGPADHGWCLAVPDEITRHGRPV